MSRIAAPLLALTALVMFVLVQGKLFVAHEYASAYRDYDGVHYLETAETGVENGFHGPGYPAVIRATSALGLDMYASAKIISRAAGLVALVMIWLVFWRLSNSVAASATVLLTVVSQVFVQNAHAVMSDMLAAALFWIALASAIVPLRARISATSLLVSLLMGAAIGAAYLTRYAYLAALVIPLLLLATSKEAWRWRLAHVGVSLAGFALVAGWWLSDVAQNPHMGLFGTNYQNVAFRVLTGGTDWSQFRQDSVHSLTDVIRAAPVAFFANWVRSLASFPEILAAMVKPFGVLVLFGLVAESMRFDRRRLVLALALAVYVAMVAVAWLEQRILLPLLPLAAFLLAEGIEVCVGLLTRWRRLARLRLSITVVVVGVVMFGTALVSLPAIQRLLEPRTECEIAEAWLKERGVKPTTPVACSIPLIAARAGARAYELRNFNDRESELLRQLQGGYLVLDRRGARDAPYFQRLFRLPKHVQPPRGLTELYRLETPRLVIYAVGSSSANVKATLSE